MFCLDLGHACSQSEPESRFHQLQQLDCLCTMDSQGNSLRTHTVIASSSKALLLVAVAVTFVASAAAAAANDVVAHALIAYDRYFLAIFHSAFYLLKFNGTVLSISEPFAQMNLQA